MDQGREPALPLLRQLVQRIARYLEPLRAGHWDLYRLEGDHRLQLQLYFLVRVVILAGLAAYVLLVGHIASGLLSAGGALLAIGAYVLAYALLLWHGLRQPDDMGLYRQLRVLDMLGMGLLMAHDPYGTTPTLTIIGVLVLESGFRHGLRFYTEGVVLACGVAVAALLVRALYTEVGLPLITLFMCGLFLLLGVYTYLLLWRLDWYQRQLQLESHHDSLTGLLNRRGLREAGSKLLRRALQRGEPVALLYGDLNGFKQVNDRHGHDSGDRLLREVARSLVGTLRPGDVIARCGGDEFAMLLPGAVRAQAEQLGERIAGVLGQLAVEGGGRIGISLGAAVAPADGSTLEALLDRADSAMYHVKAQGRRHAPAA